jgi:translation elongation factor EF-G
MNKKGNKKNKTLKKSKNNKTNKISQEEMDKCNNFCSKSYLEKIKNNIRKTYKIKGKTNYEIEKLLKNINMNEKIDECKKTFCNSNCKNKKMRYVCPACLKKFSEIKKLGAITYCTFDNYI